MIERGKQLVTEHKTALLVILCLLIVCVAYAIGRHSASEQTTAEKPAVMTQTETQEAERKHARTAAYGLADAETRSSEGSSGTNARPIGQPATNGWAWAMCVADSRYAPRS